jgi:hypothetical protein
MKWREAGEECIMRSFITRTLHRIFQGDQVKQDEMDWGCSMHGRYHQENLETDGGIILELMLGIYGGQMWIGCIWFRIGLL